MDIKTTLFHKEFEENIYMQQPEDFIVFGKKDYACLLNKSMYGLMQPSRQCYKRFDSFMTIHNYIWSGYYNCVYFRKRDGELIIYLLLYIDDMHIVAKDKADVRKGKSSTL